MGADKATTDKLAGILAAKHIIWVFHKNASIFELFRQTARTAALAHLLVERWLFATHTPRRKT